jgi:hypothetical protein
MSRMALESVTRIGEDGTVWRSNFRPGLNLLIGERNTSKTTTLRIIDFCFGDNKTATTKFGSSIASEYAAFEVGLTIDGHDHSLRRETRTPRRQGATLVNGSWMRPEEFNQWIMTSLAWPEIDIPRGLRSTVTETIPLTFRTLYRHIYRKADSWTEFASQEQEHHRRAVVAFFMGIAEEVFRVQAVQVGVAQLEAEINELDHQRREMIEIIGDVVGHATSPNTNSSVGVDELPDLLRRTESSVQDLNDERLELLGGIRSVQGYGDELDAELRDIQVRLDEYLEAEKELRRITEEQSKFITSLQADRDRLERAVLSAQLLQPIVVTTCPACLQAIERAFENAQPAQGSDCYVCGQQVAEDTRVRRIELERTTIDQEIRELEALVSGSQARLDELNSDIEVLKAARDSTLAEIDRRRRDLVAPTLSRLEHLQYELGQLQQLRGTLQGLLGLQSRIDDFDLRKQESIRRLDALETSRNSISTTRGILQERSSEFALSMQEFINDLDLPGGLGGRIEIDPSDMTFYVGREPWHNALGDERRVLFFLAYHYAHLDLFGRHLIPHPGIVVLDNPFQHDVPSDLVIQGIRNLVEIASSSDAQIILATRRGLDELAANRIYFDDEFNTEI